MVGGVDERHPEVYALDSADNGFADVWHTDVTFVARPPLGSILRAVTLPPSGGDTTWADSQLAYDSLAEPVRRLVDQLVAVHDGNREFGYYLAQRRGGRGNVWEGEVVTRLDPVEHRTTPTATTAARAGSYTGSPCGATSREARSTRGVATWPDRSPVSAAQGRGCRQGCGRSPR
ncbi:TauD/TfdA dioxygenase family protein [Micromonospora sp. NPDC003944]